MDWWLARSGAAPSDLASFGWLSANCVKLKAESASQVVSGTGRGRESRHAGELLDPERLVHRSGGGAGELRQGGRAVARSYGRAACVAAANDDKLDQDS